MYDAQFYRTRTDFGCLGNFSAKTRLHFTAQEVLYHHNITKATTHLRIECYNNRVNGIEKNILGEALSTESPNFGIKLFTKPNFRFKIVTKLRLKNLDQINNISTELQLQNLHQPSSAAIEAKTTSP